MQHLLAGVGRADISPCAGVPQGGWGAQTHQRGLGCDMPLLVTALVISDGNVLVAIIDMDAIGFDDVWTGKIISAVVELTGIAPDHVRFSCTHTHSGPNTFRLSTISEGLDMVLSYLDGLPMRVAGAVWQAQQSLKPVRIGFHSGHCEINVNRRFRTPDGQMVVGRNWRGRVNHKVNVLRFDDLDENPIATIVHYACHPTTMAWQCQYFTPDYPGVVRKVVEQQVGGACLFLQGATGNLTPRRGFTGDLKVYRRLGTILGLEAAKLSLSVETHPRREHFAGVLQSGTGIALYEDRPWEPETPVLRVKSRFVDLPVKNFPPPQAAEKEARELEQELVSLRAKGDDASIRAATSRATQALMRADRCRLYHGKTHIPRFLQGIRVGSTALISMPGEPFIEINDEIVEHSPFHDTLFSGYSNGGFGYLPSRASFAEGGYEVETSPFAVDAADVLVREALELLGELNC